MTDTALIMNTGLTGRYIKKRDKRYCCYDHAHKFLDAFMNLLDAHKLCSVFPSSQVIIETVGASILMQHKERPQGNITVYKLVDGVYLWQSDMSYDRYQTIRLTWGQK